MGNLQKLKSFGKLTLICFSEQGLGESDVLLKLDTRSEEFMDYKDVFQEPEGKEEDNKDSVYLCWKIPAGGKKKVKKLKT